ncbi:MAG: cation:proton antiporter [Candidatus Nanopelagicales bacterium]
MIAVLVSVVNDPPQDPPILDNAVGLLFCVLAVVLFLPPIMERLRIPGLLGMILGGFLIGPAAFNLIDGAGLQALGSVGLLYLMFLAGLELDLGLFNRNRGAGVRFGLLTFAFPFVLGVIAGLWVGLDTWALVLIGSVWASHTLVTYPIVQRRGLVASRSVAISVGATVITDTLALLVLAVVAGGDSQANPLVTLTVGLAVLGGFTLLVLPRAARWWFKNQGQTRAARFVFVFMAFLAAALVAEAFGVEGIVGAFFAGLGLNRSVPNGSPLMEATEFVGNSLFIPFFLISIGLLIDPGVMFQSRTLQVAAAFAVAVVVGKGLAAVIAGRLSRYSWNEAGLMFSLTLPQAAATLAAASVGFAIGLFDEVVLNAVLVVVVVSLLISSAMTQFFAKRVPVPRLDARRLGERVVVGLADEAQAQSLLPLALAIARSDAGTVNPVHVIATELTAVSRSATEMTAALSDVVAAHGGEGRPVVRLDQTPALGVRNAAIEIDASLVIIGSRLRRSVTGWFRDRSAEQIVAAAPVPVLVIVDLPHVRRVVVPVYAADTLDTAVITSGVLADLAARVRVQWHCGLLVVAESDVPDDALTDFSGAQVERVTQDPVAWLVGNVTDGDLVLGATGSGATVIDGAYGRLTGTPGVGLAVVAGPGQAGTGFAPGLPSPFLVEE